MWIPTALFEVHAFWLQRIVRSDPERMRILGIVRELGLPDCWVAAGFVRNAIWNALHGRPVVQDYDDVDVIWFDGQADLGAPETIEAMLRRVDPSVRWSVKNQAQMHSRNADPPYASSADAMCHWVETTAAIAVRLDSSGAVVFSAPLGTEDLFAMVIRPGPRFMSEKHGIFLERVREKCWFERWPLLRLIGEVPSPRRS